MAKGKSKNRNDSLAEPQQQPLRLRKRERPSEEISETDDVQTSLPHQDTVRNNTAVDATLLQESKHDPATGKNHTETTNNSLKNVTAEDFEGQEELLIKANNDTQLEGFRVHTDNDANKSGKGEKSLSQTCTDQPQVLLPTSEEGDGSCATTLEHQLSSKENSQCNLERNQENGHEECSSMCMNDAKEVKKEAVAGLPAKKKRRMGTLGPSEKKQGSFLQTQKCENGQNRTGKSEQCIINNTADHSPSIPAGSDTEQNEPKIQLQSSHCGVTDRAEPEGPIAVTASAGTNTVDDPGCSKGKSCETEQTGDTMSNPPTNEELLGNQKQQELEVSRAESMAGKPQELMKNGEDKSAAGGKSPVISFYTTETKNEETEDQAATEAATEAAPLNELNSMARTKDENNKELTDDAGDGDGAGRSNFGSVEVCDAAVSPTGSERKDSADPDDKPGAGPSTVKAAHPQTRDATDPFETGCSDYVSDSQLNTITLTEVEVLEAEDALSSLDCHDATDLICGLIKELSTLNRKVMATHKELENLRRSSKSSRSSTR